MHDVDYAVYHDVAVPRLRMRGKMAFDKAHLHVDEVSPSDLWSATNKLGDEGLPKLPRTKKPLLQMPQLTPRREEEAARIHPDPIRSWKAMWR